MSLVDPLVVEGLGRAQPAWVPVLAQGAVGAESVYDRSPGQSVDVLPGGVLLAFGFVSLCVGCDTRARRDDLPSAALRVVPDADWVY